MRLIVKITNYKQFPNDIFTKVIITHQDKIWLLSKLQFLVCTFHMFNDYLLSGDCTVGSIIVIGT